MIDGLANLATGLIDRFFPPDATPEQKAAAANALSAELSARDKAKSAVMVAEMQQSDNYTKRARPTVVYGGLAMIAINYVIFPFTSRVVVFFSDTVDAMMVTPMLEPIPLPGEFWAAWGGVVSVWVLGRSMEKRGTSGNLGKLTSMITGAKNLLD